MREHGLTTSESIGLQTKKERKRNYKRIHIVSIYELFEYNV